MFRSKHEELFWQLYNCKTEQEVDRLLQQRPEVFTQSNWYPLGPNLGSNQSNFSIVENQQSNPVAALVEKLTNAIDAILVRRCYEEGIQPESKEDTPKSINEAVRRFFPEYENWDLPYVRTEQARSIQVIADGSIQNTSVIVYDDGEGQHPEHFEDTFLSLMRGNKQRIRFVHGKYNMGGTGALVFCGRKRFQLIASKRYDNKGRLGFTLVREHPLSRTEASQVKDTWYEYLKIDGEIPAFEIDEIDIGLHRRLFQTGTIFKLYSYDLSGNRNFIRDLAPSLDQFLYNPALPYTIVESKKRFKRSKEGYALANYGLKRKLDNSEFVETSFPEMITDRRFGDLPVNVYVFRARVEGKPAAATKKSIRDSFFKSRMQVVFSVAGQVHGHYTSEFITRTLQMNLLQNYLLIHVDCTELKYPFRRELFMASRDRLKQSTEATYLRKKLGDSLKTGQLKDIYKKRKNQPFYDRTDDESLLKEIAENLPFDKAMQDLIKQTLELDAKGKRKKPSPPEPKPSPEPFEGKRYPSFIRIKNHRCNDTPTVMIPKGDSKTLQFESDVNDDYFDRANDPGGLELTIMSYTPNDETGGDQRGTVNDISEIFSIIRRSPQNGKIRVVFEPTRDVEVDDEIEVRADLLSSAEPDGALSTMFWVKITEPQEKRKPHPKPEREEKLGLPEVVRVYRQPNGKDGITTWDDLEKRGTVFDHAVVMHPEVEGDMLEKICINMDSGTLKRFVSKRRNPTEEQRELADREYLTRVYWHTLFLYAISRGRNYAIVKGNAENQMEDIDLSDYLKDVFDSNYAEFLLNFETAALMEGLG